MNKILFFLLFLSVALNAVGQNEAPPVINASPRVNYYVETARPAEQIRADYPYDIALRTAKGDTLNSSDIFAQNGKPTVLLFWLTTCMPCRRELAAITEKFESWQKEADFNLYAISIDFPRNYEQFVRRVEDSNWPFPAFHDLNREFRVILPGQLNGLPQTFIVDKNGNIVHHTRKFVPGDEDHLFELIKSVQ